MVKKDWKFFSRIKIYQFRIFLVVFKIVSQYTLQILLISSYMKPEEEEFNKRSDWVICLGYA